MATLSDNDKRVLLALARESLTAAANGNRLPEPNPEELSPTLMETGATFVTLTKAGELRGCIGALEPYQPLVADVIEHAAAAAIDDFRFLPVEPDETSQIAIEISVLTRPEKLDYTQAEDLHTLIRPGIDGVVIRDGARRATFLPQVWEQLPDLNDFMAHLCRKMGASSEYWKRNHLEILLYQVIEFHE